MPFSSLRPLLLLVLVLSVAVSPCQASRVMQDGAQSTEAVQCLTRPPAGLQPPLARKVPKRLDTAAGPILDDFYWLRDDTRSDPAVLAYLSAENAYADEVLRPLQPLAAQLANELEGRLSNTTQPVPVRHGSWWYSERQTPGQSFWTRYRQPAKRLNTSSSSSSSQAGPWDESGPEPDSPEQVVLDPNYECALAAGPGGAGGPEHCDVFGAVVSPDGSLVALGVDVSGGEQYQLVVRHIASSRPLLPAPIPGTSGDYEWSAGSDGLFFITRNATTNRPDQAWFVRLDDPGAARLLWQEENPAFYLSLSRTSSGAFLLLAAASEVTRQVLLLDLAAASSRPPSPSDWLQLAPRQPGVRQQAVAHWQSWLFVLVVSPEAPNGELRVAPLSNPQQHTVLLAHRQEVELEDVRLFAHHLVLAERQLGHTTITVYCLPADGSAAAAAACRYNSTAASAAEAQAAAAAEQAAAAADAQLPASSSSTSSSSGGSSSGGHLAYDLVAESDAAADAAAAAELEQQIVADAGDDEGLAADLAGAADNSAFGDSGDEQLLDIGDAAAFLAGPEPGGDEEQPAALASSTFLLIRGRAGSSPAGQVAQEPPSLRDPAVAVEQQRLQQQQQQQQAQQQSQGKQARSKLSSSHSSKDKDKTDKKASSSSSKKQTGSKATKHPGSSPDSKGGKAKAKVGKAKAAGKPPARAAAAATAASRPRRLRREPATLQLPLLSPANSWQVAFEEGAYSVSIVEPGDWSRPELSLSYTSFTTPHSIIDIDMTTQRRRVRPLAVVGGGFRSSAYRSYRLWAAAADGVEVPLSLVHRLDKLRRGGANPALLLVYGAYGTKYEPEFDDRLLALLDRGWLVGIAHVRGGGELGYAWHDAGRLAAKANSWGDLAAAAAALVATNLTSHDRLAVWGRSAGALTAAAAVNASPGLFAAVLLDVPFLDVLGDLLDGSLPLTVKEWEEWGNPAANASAAALIVGYSPVHNVVRGAAYPHMLVTAGLMDRRVGYWEAAKWVAQLRAAAAEPVAARTDDDDAAGSSSSSDALDQLGLAGGTAAAQPPAAATDGRHQQQRQPQPRDRLLLLRTDMSGGHFSASGSGGSLDDAAVKIAFLLATLPSCDGPGGPPGPGAQHQPAAGRASLLGGGGSWAHTADRLLAALARLPVPALLRQLLVVLTGAIVAVGLVGVVWQVSRVWLPPGISPSELYQLVDSDDPTISELLSAAHHRPGHGSGSSSKQAVSVATRSSAKLGGTGPGGRDVARRISTAATSSSGSSEQQRLLLHQSLGEAPGMLLASSGGPCRQEPFLISGCSSGSSGAANLAPGSQVVLAGLLDEQLMELTSGVPRSSRPSHHHSQQQQQQQQQQGFGLDTSGSAGSSSALSVPGGSTSLRTMARRCSNGAQQ